MKAKPILSSENFSQLLDQSLGNNYDAHQTARMALASTLCIKALRKYQATESVYHSLKSILHRAFYWNNLGFGLKRTDYMYTGKCIHNESFQHRRLRDCGNVELSPAAGVLNYGQLIFSSHLAYLHVIRGCLDSLFSTTIWRLDMFLGVVWIAYFQQPFWHLDTLSRAVWVSHFNNHFGTMTCS
ncbi:Aminotransferase, class IV [Artemisia annua]|uniref:Aminotransferase, class IV n=1 Tax=Artemisia annua TaxID=35608 RepID=A0A2U1KWN7_ARTAN|nr:Aminotransferase, class IV [Artemisia annua]